MPRANSTDLELVDAVESSPASEVTPRPKRQHVIPFRYFYFLLFGVIAVGAVVQMTAAPLLIRSLGDTTYPESGVIRMGLMYLHTGHMYRDINAHPYTAAAYGPLFYTGLSLIAGLVHADFMRLLFAARFVDYCFFLGIALVVFLVSRRCGWPHSLCLLAGLSACFSAEFWLWNASARPDIPAVCFGLAALCFALGTERRFRWNFVASGACIAVSLLLKQSIVAAGIAIAAWLIAGRRYRDFVAYAACVVAPVSIVLAIVSRKEPVLHSLALLRFAPKDPAGAFILLRHAVLRPENMFLLALGLVGLMVGSGTSANRLLKTYLLVAWTVPLACMLQSGANANYLFEGWTACALLLPNAAHYAEANWPRWSQGLRVALIVALAIVSLSTIGRWKMFTFRRRPHEYPAIAALNGFRVLSDVSILSANGRDPELLDPYMNHQLAVTGHWSPEPIVAQVDREAYDLAFVSSDGRSVGRWRGLTMFDERILSAVNRNYTVVCKTPSMTVLIPRSRHVQLTSADASNILNDQCRSGPSTLAAAVHLHSPE